MKKKDVAVWYIPFLMIMFLCGVGYGNALLSAEMHLIAFSDSGTDTDEFSFDQLLCQPQTSNLIDMCMHVCEEMPLLKEIHAVEGFQAVATDAMLGKAARLDFSIQRVLKQNRVAGFSGIHQDESLYMLELLDHIEHACIEIGIMPKMNVSHTAPTADAQELDVKQMLHTIKVRLKQVADTPECM